MENSTTDTKTREWSHFIIENTPAGIITLNDQGRVTDCNPAAGNIIGLSQDQIIGRLAHDVLSCKLAGQETCSSLTLAMLGQNLDTQELSLLCSEGQEVPVMLKAFALEDYLGNKSGMVIIFQDLTSVKKLEKERRQLVDMFAHDLKAPIVGMAGLIRRLRQGKLGPLSEPQMAYLETVYNGMTKLEDLITKFLDLSRLDLRVLTPLPSAIQVENECQQVIDSFLPLAEDKRIDLASDFPQEIIVLQADPLLFRRVLENLLENAIKYAPPQTSVILQVQANEKELRFAVKDQGPGISPKDVPHIFEIFYRGSEVGYKKGFGLGLATVDRIIKAHGGRIWVETVLGQGTTFFLTLPDFQIVRLSESLSSKNGSDLESLQRRTQCNREILE
jgi:PAS domain S-box-containing protein